MLEWSLEGVGFKLWYPFIERIPARCALIVGG